MYHSRLPSYHSSKGMFGVAFLLMLSFFVFCKGQCTSAGGGTASNCKYFFRKPQEFWDFSTDHTFVPPVFPGKTIVGPGSKLLFDLRSTPYLQPGFWFADMTLYPSHLNLISALGLSNEYNSNSNQYYRCDFQSYILPDGSFYFAFTYNPGSPLSQNLMIQTCRVAADHIPLRNTTKIGFVSLDSAAQPITSTAKSYCEGLGFTMATGDEVLALGSTDPYIPLHPGQAYGYLREFPSQPNLLAAKDIPIFNAIPLELSVVSGVITSVFQTVNSHVNLKSNERDTPNMILLNYDKYPCIKSYINKPTSLTVATYGWSVSSSSVAEVDAKYSQRLAIKKWLSLYHDTSNIIESYDQMCAPEDPAGCLLKKKIFGTKASSLGFLRNKYVLGKKSDNTSLSASFGYDLTPIGFGIPFQFYVDFVNYPPNSYIKPLINDLVKMETEREPFPAERANISKLLKEAFWNGTVPPNVLNALKTAIDLHFTPFKVNQLKLRSSSNAEDLPGFDGAGLYDSFSADVGTKTPKNLSIPCHYDPTKDDMVPSSLECALKGVYGSLWNQRAIEERTFARYKHETCTMGIAVIPKYKEMGTVTANSVAVTRLMDGNTERAGYTYSIQKDDNDVTNPDPGTTSETSIAYINPDKTWTWKTERFATPFAGGPQLTTPVLNFTLMQQMQTVVIQAEYAYCLYKFNLTLDKCKNLILNNVKTALDIEFKFIDGYRVHCKQLREFSGTKKTDYVITNSSCGYIDPSYFPPVNGISYNNVALKKPVTCSNNRTISTTLVVGGGVTTIVAYAFKANDGLVEVSDGSVAASDTWWQVVFDLPYTIHYVRIFWCRTSYTAPSFTLTFGLKDGTSTVKSFTPVTSSNRIQTLNVTQIKDVTRLRLTATSSYLCMAEVQVFALPYRTGDPTDFLPDDRTDTQDCVWDNWSNWSACSVPCAGGTQNRTRGGKWCVNYITLEQFSESQPCNLQVCPVDCKWNEWTAWDTCSSCGWTRRTRTNVPPIGTGKPCLEAHQEDKECILQGIPCNLARPVIFTITTSTSTNLTTIENDLKDLILHTLKVDSPGNVNVYLVVENTTATGRTVRVTVSFNSPNSDMPYALQDTMAQNFSRLLLENSAISTYVSPMAPRSVFDVNLQNYGVGYGVQAPTGSPTAGPSGSPSSTPTAGPLAPGGSQDVTDGGGSSSSSPPMWVWIVIGVLGFLILVGIIGFIIYRQLVVKSGEIV